MNTTHYSFGKVRIELCRDGDYDVTIHLAFSLGLGNNFSYQQYIDAMRVGEGIEGAPKELIEYLSECLSMSDNITIVDSAGKMLRTCGSGLADHLR